MEKEFSVYDDLSSFKQRLLVFEAKRWLNFTESGGDNKGQIVEMFQRHVDGAARGEPWCMSFAQFCIGMVDKLVNELHQRTLKHKTCIYSSEHCLMTWRSSPPETQLFSPFVGTLMIWQKGFTSAGHVGIVISVDLKQGVVWTIEGNTGSSEEVTRDGDGVYLKKRTISGTNSMRVKGWLMPWQN